MKQFYIIFFTLISFVSSAQQLLKDIITSNASSHPRSMVEANGKHFFLAKEGTNFTELWVTDGTTANTIALTSNPLGTHAPSFEYLDEIYSIGNKIVFSAFCYRPNYLGKELWVSDGTSSGTFLLKDIYPGSISSYPRNFYRFGNKLIFTATDILHGEELWITDGTSDGTHMLKDFNPGPAGSPFFPNSWQILGDKLFFGMTTAAYGNELWVTDGTEAGTVLVKDINEGSSSSSPRFFTVLNDKLYFRADNSIYGGELWVSDGTESGTNIVKDIKVGSADSSPSQLTVLNGKIIFAASGPDFTVGLWTTDGTSDGTVLFKKTNPFGSSYANNFTKLGNNILFTATDGINGIELWKTDGTELGTVMVKDINPNSTGTVDSTFAPYNYSSQRNYYILNNTLFFLADDGTTGYELWKSDGTTAGTMLVKDFIPGTKAPMYTDFMIFASRLCFNIKDNAGASNYWRTDGTVPGTIKLDNLNPTISNVLPLLAVSNSLQYYVAFNASTGYELFKSDGNSLSLVKDIHTGSLNLAPDFEYKGVINNNLFFSANDNKHGTELWKTNGLNNTALFKDFILFGKERPGGINFFAQYYSRSSTFSSMHKFNGYDYLTEDNRLWRTNGTNMELWQLSDYTIQYIGVLGNNLLWLTFDKLYKSDGKTVELIYTIPNVYGSPYARSSFYNINNKLYFVFANGTNGSELWKTDGTTEGTGIVKDIVPGPGSSYINNICVVGNKMFFAAMTSAHGNELWVSDGTEAGTVFVKDIYPGSMPSGLKSLTNLDNKFLIFRASDGVHGEEYWRSDGTEAGTYMIADLMPGTGSSPINGNAQKLESFKGNVYFGAYNSASYIPNLFATDGSTISLVKSNISITEGAVLDSVIYMGASVGFGEVELWKTNGTEAGTTLVKDINVGSGSSSPQKFFAYKNYLYFIADDGVHGQELWVLRKSCLDSLNLSTPINSNSNYLTTKAIVGQTANTISSTANVTYDAGKYVLLKPGFSTNPGAVFTSTIAGCLSTANLPNTNTESEPLKPDPKTEQYLQDMLTKPSIEDFIAYGNNKDLMAIWAKFEEGIRPLIHKEHQLNFELQLLEQQKPEVQIASNQENVNNYYTSKAQKQQAYQEAKQATGQYGYIIVPIRDATNKKLGYDLTIYAAGKMYQSAIRN